MTIWTSNARIRKDICHNLYGEVTTRVKPELRSNGFTNGVLNCKFNNDGEVEHEKSDSEKYGTGL